MDVKQRKYLTIRKVFLCLLLILIVYPVHAENIESQTEITDSQLSINADRQTFDTTTSTMTLQIDTTTATFQEQIIFTGINEEDVIEMDSSFDLTNGELNYMPLDENALADLTLDGDQKATFSGTMELKSIVGDKLMFFIIDVEKENLIDEIILTEVGTIEFSYDVSDVQSVRFFAPGTGSQSVFSITDIELN